MHHTIRQVISLFLALAGLSTLSLATASTDRFDVSYLWHRDVGSVLEYRDRVARVLGPGVSKDLRVVAKGKLYGLIYDRRSDSNRAGKLARAHTRLLRSRGLEAAAPVPSRNWHFVRAGKTEHNDKQAGTRPVPRSRMSSAERAREIRDIGTAVEDYIKRLRREGKIAPDERTGWSVFDFTTGEKLVTINEDVQFQAASLVKPFIAAAFFQKVKDGDLIYGPKSRRHMEKMIHHSNNASTNWVMRQLGGPQKVERILKQRYPKIFRDTRLVEFIPANGRSYRNKASVHDYSRFLYALWKDGITGSREIKRLMAMPGSDRIYTGAREIPKGTRVYNKTGSTARVCGDMGILSVRGRDGKRYPYTIIGIIEKQQRSENYTAWIRARSNVIRNVSNIVYKGIARQHNLETVL
ncbi:MAG TPA: serine hydrolase [Gammaproteobacteria bacterium]|nr:serine hydrolase [Gammaproteobacteria bacterium]